MIPPKIYPTLTEDNEKMYILKKQMELEHLEKLISYTKRNPDHQIHLAFLENYGEVINKHIHDISSSFKLLKTCSNELIPFLNENINTIFNEKFITINNSTYYLSYNRYSFTFFTYLNEDEYTNKKAYGLITCKLNNNSFYLNELAIDFNNNSIDLLGESPKEIMQTISSMDGANTVKEILSIHIECEEAIKKLFFVSNFNDFINYDDPNFETIFGFKPIQMVQTNNVQKVKNVIRVQLNNHINNVTSDLINLIRSEHICNEVKNDPYDDEFQKSILSSWTAEKEGLMKTLNITQERLDELMSFVNLDL